MLIFAPRGCPELVCFRVVLQFERGFEGHSLPASPRGPSKPAPRCAKRPPKGARDPPRRARSGPARVPFWRPKSRLGSTTSPRSPRDPQRDPPGTPRTLPGPPQDAPGPPLGTTWDASPGPPRVMASDSTKQNYQRDPEEGGGTLQLDQRLREGKATRVGTACDFGSP